VLALPKIYVYTRITRSMC